MVVSKVVPNPTKGRKWNPRMAAQEAEATLIHIEIVGNVQIGRGGLAQANRCGVEQVPGKRES